MKLRSWIPSLVTLLILPVLLWLGFWQLDRAEQKQQLLHKFEAQQDAPLIALQTLDKQQLLDYRFRQVSAGGTYDAEQQILLDNQVVQGRAGFHVFTPLRLQASSAAILVNRGWVPLGASREELPEIALQQNQVELIGRLSQPANPGLLLTAAESQSDLMMLRFESRRR